MGVLEAVGALEAGALEALGAEGALGLLEVFTVPGPPSCASPEPPSRSAAVSKIWKLMVSSDSVG